MRLFRVTPVARDVNGPPCKVIRHLFRLSCLLFTLLAAAGCGANSSGGAELKILAQPQNATAPIGVSATFSVTAQGSGALSYQWLKNSAPILGAASSSYTTPAVTPGDSGSTYSVKVSDKSGSILSDSATLTVGPRSPMSGDLRFQQVDSAATAQAIQPGGSLILWYPIGWTYPGSVGTPIRLGLGQCVPGIPQDCGWLYTTYKLAATLSQSVSYQPDVLEKLGSDIAGLSSTAVVTSLDIESLEDVFAVSIAQGVANGFDCRQEAASLDALQSAIAADGVAGRVVTAISFDDATGSVAFLSYGWSSDKSTSYETQVMTVPYDGIGTSAQSLASSGYIITAFGGNSPDGYILVGTRVKGDTLPRPALVSPDSSTSTQGYALVGWAINTPYGSNPSAPVWLYER